MEIPPLFLGILLASLTGGILWVREKYKSSALFRWVPAPFFCYFFPLCLRSIGLLPSVSPLYDGVARFLLPVCLALLLLNVNFAALRGVGRSALLAMAWGVGGMVAGLVVSFGFFHSFLPPEAWKSVGALAGSWTGGSANLLAVKEALGASEQVFAPILVVDTLFAYSWMAFLVWMAGRQGAVDRWSKAWERDVLPVPPLLKTKTPSWPWPTVPMAALVLAGGSLFLGTTLGPTWSRAVAEILPDLGNSLKPATWTVIAVTTGSLVASLSGRFRALPERTEGVGTFFLFFLLTTLGAQASFRSLKEAPLFLAVGAVGLMIHGATLVVGARLSRLPLALLATASQACVGGVVSAPLVGAVYRSSLAAVGLLLAVLGNVGGTYVGLLTAHLCSWIGN